MLILLPLIQDVSSLRARPHRIAGAPCPPYLHRLLHAPLLTALSLRHHIDLHIPIHHTIMTAHAIEQCAHCPVSLALGSVAKSGAASIAQGSLARITQQASETHAA